ncbi:hypothetical protein DICPUDRAFT_54646 [Dictyostelium purpureum]|uniref:EGF-like domain-containing protein n=1 Tax=Dictyostelium purpureum TaxID=5786 RepID=F0ZI16_DICPU|nr:uncharacterized protein DICPUDRAFT_54646 [Dictyostelium purpureum]EGC36415.1 hypothetical protein DICPUDRAFT_54646 [Dictyostelium purpureum]|eukprot:XP_003287048.1 hypothetical protein DICPUDRAFT_54646 [Dictyostelium purpureum]
MIVYTNKIKNRNNLLYFFGILYIVCLWAIVSASPVDVVTGRTSSESCPYQALPTTLDDLNFLGFNGDFHIHETYYYDFSSFQKSISFTLKEESAFRVYVAPHIVDIDLWLYQGSGTSINHTSDATQGSDESLYAKLGPGSYTLKFLFFGQNKGKKLDCPTIELEIAISPISVIESRLDQYKNVCPPQQILPNLPNNLEITKVPFVFDSDIDQTQIINLRDVEKDTLTIVTQYNIILPSTQDKYSIDVTLGFDFLTGGSINVLLQEQSVSQPDKTFGCIKTNNCTIGVHTGKGHSNIRATLYPGTYTLYIIDQTYEKDYRIAPDCTQFSLYVNVDAAQKVEDFLNCQEYELPKSFNEPGYLNDGGYLYFDEDILLDLSVNHEQIPFNITEQSFFRAYIPDYRIDIDVRLTQIKDDGKKVTIASSFKFGGEEEITANIGGGSYVLEFYYFGKRADVFCDTFALEVAIQPTSDFINSCTGSSEISPPLDQLNSTLYESGQYLLGYTDKGGVVPTIYQVPTPTDQKAHVIKSTIFSVPDDTIYFFESIVESSFVTADIRLVLVDLKMDPEDQSDILYVGTHDRNRHAIALYLYPGNYSLQIQTGSTSKHAVDDLPTCLAYSLAIRLRKQDKSRPSCDLITRELPTTLNSPAYLGSSEHVQIAGEFFFPPSNFVLYGNDEITFKTKVDSIIRAYTQYNPIDIDMTIYEGDTPVAWTNRFYSEEALVYTLKAGTDYKLRLKYIHVGTVSSCIPYQFGLTISPKSDNPKDTCSSTQNSLPAAGWIPDASHTPVYIQDNFYFRQTNVEFDQTIQFQVPAQIGNSLFRAILSSDFIWNNLAFELRSVNNEKSISSGELTYNRLEIPTIELVPGSYALRIYEPFSNNIAQLELRNCVDFSLEVGIQSQYANSVNDVVVCPGIELPNTFNSIGFMSNLTSNSFSFAENIVAKVEDGKDIVNFTVTEASMLRIYVPPTSLLRMNIALLNSQGKYIVNDPNISEHAIYQALTPETYIIVFTYFGTSGSLPRPEDCPTFFTSISLTPMSVLSTVQSITNDCSSSSITDIPDDFSSQTFSKSFQRSLKYIPSVKTITLTNDKWAHLYVNLDYYNLVSSLSMSLEGFYYSGNGASLHKVVYPLYQSGEAFLNEILPPGNWTLKVYDPFTRPSPQTAIQCAPFTYSYALNISNTKPGEVCEELSNLPTTFKDVQTFSAKNLLMKDTQVAIPITVSSKTTMIRIYTNSYPGSQVLLNLYTDNTRKESLTPKNNLWKLDVQNKPYVLVISFKRNSNLDCNYYDLEMESDHFDSIQTQLLCPAKMPNEALQVPAETVHFKTDDDYFQSYDRYFFSSSRVQNNIRNGTFRYRISMTVPTQTFIDARVSFDFLANDFDLIFGIKNSDNSDREIIQGSNVILASSNSDFDISNKISYQIPTAGTYFLDITQRMSYDNFGVVNSCHYFAFSLSGVPTGLVVPPKILSVNPPNSNNISPDKVLHITLTFSEEFDVSSITTSLIDFLNSHDSVKLKYGQYGALQPYDAKFDKGIVLKVSFKDLLPATRYELIVDTTNFISVSGDMFAALNTTHIYTTITCECNGHGRCDNPSDTECNCDAPWAGRDCSKCMVGYHGVGNECVPNSDCNDKTCNGHGKCSNPTGVPQCACNLGYNSPNTTALCGDCAYGYQGYPNCKPIPVDEDAYCYAPIIPRNLSHIQYLGFDGKLHLQDDFYIDMATGGHDTFIPITKESLLRIYTEPHHVDVDLWLYTVDVDDNMINVIERSITFNREEILLIVLQPGYYRLSFKYFNWNKVSLSNCETFNLELAIDDLESLKNNTNQLVKSCDNTPLLGQEYFIPKTISQNFTKNDNALYRLDSYISNQIVYLWNSTFTVSPGDGQVILADIELSYQFLIGDVSMVIISGNNTAVAPSCKGSTDTSISGCIFGDNELNRNVIHATLNPGDYTIFLYAPEFTNITSMNCVLFNMKTQFTLINDEEDYFNCLGEPIPPSLNSPEFLINDYLHIQDLYLITKREANIKFDVSQQCLVRVHAQQNSAINIVSLKNLATGDVYMKQSDTIYLNVAAGSYQLTISSNRIASSKNFCPVVNLEIAIEPSDTKLLLDDNCPTNNAPNVPLINNMHPPFIFENGTKTKQIYTFPANTDATLVAMYTLILTQVSQIYTAVASEFLRGDLRVNLYKKLDDGSLMLSVKGIHDYNYNWIQEQLDPGSYVIKIMRPDLRVVNKNSPSCIPFEFEYSVLPLNKLPMCPGEPLPLDFNSVRFLGSEGRMHYQSDRFIVPNDGIYSFVKIPIMISKKSVLRLYVNPHIVDIDIKLLDSTDKVIISGSNLIGSEEAFVTLLDKVSKPTDTEPKYFIQLQFWRWSKNIPQCNTFSLEIGVSPLDEVSIEGNCPAGKTPNLWPSIPTNYDSGKFNYSNLLTDTKLYFQQTSTGPVSQSYTIVTKVPTNIHIQTGYNFLTGDLAVKLVSSAKNKKTYNGVSAPNRNILEVVNLPAGTYTLTLYEPFTSLDQILGCSYFNFEFYMEPYSNLDQIDGFYHYLPETLNTYAYLNYNNHVHLQGEYMMYDGNPLHNQVQFTLSSKSLIRIQASILPDNELDTYNLTNVPVIYISDKNNKVVDDHSEFGSYVTILSVGDYTLNFGNPFFTVSNVPVDVEIAISTLDQIEKTIATIPYPADCPLSPPMTIVPSTEDGTFFYHELLTIPAEKMTESSNILHTQFTLEVPSKIYIQIGYQFILGDLNVHIYNNDVSLSFIGKANRNTNDINAELLPGIYNLDITSIHGLPAEISPHCTPYNLAIIIRHSSSDIHGDCSIFNAIPWDLNSLNGGSTQFGGPIDANGYLRMYSDDFIAPSNAASRNISLTVSQDTFINIFTIDNLAAAIDSDVFTQDTAIDQDLIFYTSLHSSAQRSSTYLAQTSKSSNFDISLSFTGISKGSCPAFGLQIVTKPASYLTDQLLCPANFIAKLPNASPKLDTQGSFVEYISSYITGDYINKHKVKTQFEYYVDFEITKTSRVEASFSFDSIATNFYIKLATRNPNTNARSVIGTADWNAELSYGETSMTSIISTGNLRAGLYSIVIVHPPAINPLIQSSSIYNDLCLPFTYSLVIMDNSKVYIGSFSPSNGHNIVPSRDLVLTFSTQATHYDANGNQILCNSSSIITDSLYLASQTSSDSIHPTSVMCLQDDGTKWSLNFSSATLSPDTTHILSLAPNQIFDSDKNPSILPPQHVYNFIDTSCSNNGGFKNDKCECSTGYGGVDCYYCNNGYYNINKGSGPPVCVSQTCKIDTCNCDPNISGTCISLGKCMIDQETDTAYCICAKQYNGTTCNTCANGYQNYPQCTPHFECGGCGEGTCDYTLGQCKCPSNFEGPNCSECASGYHGKDCAKNGSGAIIALEVIATLVAVSIVIGVGIWYVRTRYRSGVARYKMLPKFEFDDDEHTTKFPGLYDDDEDDLQFKNNDKKDTSINRGGGKTHVFSFSSMPVSALDSDDSEDERLQESNSSKNQKNNKHLFDL